MNTKSKNLSTFALLIKMVMMKKNALIFIAINIFFLSNLFGKPLPLNEKQLTSPPPRIIRTCCMFGSDIGLAIIPFYTVSDIIAAKNIGPHQYLGSEKEGNGIIYTTRGGFIDLGHLRDQADWTAYLYSLILHHKLSGEIIQNLGYEGGPKRLTAEIPADIENADALLFAGRIAYDLSIWHEIATWFGASSVPFVPERFSSFSVEDAYSNLLGVHIAMKALASELPYEEAMTLLLSQTLTELGALQTEEENRLAMEAVRDIWWTREKGIPSKKVLLERELDVYSQVKPMLVDGYLSDTSKAYVLEVPMFFTNGENIESLYSLEFRLNFKFPVRRIFPDQPERNITQANFDMMIHSVQDQIQYKSLRKAKLSEEVPDNQHNSKVPRSRNRTKSVS